MHSGSEPGESGCRTSLSWKSQDEGVKDELSHQGGIGRRRGRPNGRENEGIGKQRKMTGEKRERERGKEEEEEGRGKGCVMMSLRMPESGRLLLLCCAGVWKVSTEEWCFCIKKIDRNKRKNKNKDNEIKSRNE